ncbi:N-acetylmuramidase family protein [Mesorhizobium sp.]|uniref:N-acetylmuramidase family protein n=2 Tax=Mesorhizobium sp. TaxID=1871066 RepID=UPI002580D8FC|nr:N-acetylmuramidase family protein [Mesorhizobium sp.]
MDTTFKGAARRLDDLDLPKLGARIGVGEDEIHAFLDVETSGHGFDAHGRPIILFEPHVFFRNLSGAKRAQAVAAGLAYVRWGEKPYPRDSYPRLKAAIAIDETAALRSASWGLGQVLGENFKAAGFPTVQAMVEAMMEDEALQLAAAVNFIAANRLDGKLRKHDWAGFAKGYNGASFGKNAYDYQACRRVPQKWSGIRTRRGRPLPQHSLQRRFLRS